VVLAVLCTLTRPVFTTLQEAHELRHLLTIAETDSVDVDGGTVDEPDLDTVFHAPHCCVHAVVLPPTLMLAPLATPQVPPRHVAATPHASPLARFLRPPIFA
jgi:hypothetical protein